MENLQKLDLLRKVRKIIDTYDKKLDETGERFNLISLLGMEHNERYTHSNIIAELLNPKGSHGYGSIFLQLFLENLKITGFQIEDCRIITEEYVGSINCSDGSTIRTFLDIVIKEKSGRVILIENKIWAKDQHLQIERYYDTYKEKIVKLFYLNVNEWNDCPTKRTDVLSVFQNISYKNEINNWLQECLKNSKEKALVHYQIQAYKNIVAKISNQNIYQQMSIEIKNTITESLINFKSAKEIAENYNLINNEITSTFFNKLKIFLNDGEIVTKYGILKYSIAEDSYDPLYLGFQLYSNGIIVLDNEEFNSIIENLRIKFKSNLPKSNNSWNIWFSLSNEHFLHQSFIRFLDPEKKLHLYKNMDDEVQKAVNEFQAILSEFKTH